MKLMITDDEPKIRRGLYNYFVKSDLDFDSIDIAENGIIALEKATNDPPDILLADICMPKMDGLEFIGSIRRRRDDIRIVIITGHNNFSYAQTAIRHGVDEYVLKPIDLPQLYMIVKRLYDDVLTKKRNNKYNSFALDIIRSNKQILISHLFKKLFSNLISPTDIVLAANNIGFSIPDPACVMIVKIVSPIDSLEWSSDLLNYAINNIVFDVCSNLEGLLCINDANNNTVVLSSHNQNTDYSFCQDAICKSIGQHLGLSVRSDMTFLSNVAHNLAEIHRQMIRNLSAASGYSLNVINAKNYIMKNYHEEDLSLDTVADELHVSAPYLSRLMRKELGMGFTNYLQDVRMKNAAIMLSNNERDVKLYEIAQQLGYSSQHYFTRVFTKYYGMSPTQYRYRDGGKHQ